MGVSRPFQNELLQQHTPCLFVRSPGLTLESLIHLDHEYKNKLTGIEKDINNAKRDNDPVTLNQIAVYFCYRANEITLFQMLSNSSTLRDLLTSPQYNHLWEQRIQSPTPSARDTDALPLFNQWQLDFLKRHYEPWERSPYANHEAVQPLKNVIQQLEPQHHHNQTPLVMACA